MEQQKLKEIWLDEERVPFEGWDFSRLDGHWESEPLDWDYREIVRSHLRPQHALLDMGTGGGEFLLGLGHPYGNTAVTEAWEPNIKLCRQRLAPLGVRVFAVKEDAVLPIPDSRFDIMINRHEAYDVHEVFRILKPGGLFITQQVGCQNNLELARRLNGGKLSPRAEFSLETERKRFQSSGLNILLGRECFPKLRFYDIGALVYWAKAIVWECPGFAVESRLDILYALQAELERDGYVPGRQHRFIIVADKAQV